MFFPARQSLPILRRFAVLFCVAFLGLFSGAPSAARGNEPPELPPAADVKVDFARDVKPLLAAKCYSCHGADEAKGGLQLHRRADAFDGGEGGAVITPGRSAESRLIRYVAGIEAGYEMPPDGEPLTAAQIALLRAWIDQGAMWPASADVATKGSDHWAYRPVVRKDPPTVKNTSWPRNAIDHFVLAKLEIEGLAPSAEADRAVLLRRVSLDLTGLPPTLAEVDAFLADQSPEAYEHVVDRLLASPHYGERWARPWLDLARYADTHGFEKDPKRVMFRYRDWVIGALNADMPFDQFTIEQLAGDMLPSATLEQRIASGFHRNTMINTEGGVDPEEARVATIVDRVNTTATVWLGTTLACAQCHTHKYDPLRQKEYYQFYSFFNSVDEPEIDAPTAEQAAASEKLRTQIAALEAKLNTPSPELDAAQAAWEARLVENERAWQTLDPASALSAGGATLTRQADHSVLASGVNPANDTYTLVANTDLKNITALRVEALPDASLPQASLGRHTDGSFVLSRVEVSAAPLGEPQKSQPVALQNPTADYSQKDYGVENLLGDKPEQGWAVNAELAERRSPHVAVFELKENLAHERGATFTVRLLHTSKWPEANVGRFRVSVTAAARPVRAPALPDKISPLLAKPSADRNEAERGELAAYYRTVAPELDAARGEIESLKKADVAPPKALVMTERAEPRETHVQIRGNFLSPGRRVSPGVPSVLPPLPEGAAANRLNLARWLVDKDNPLTPRVAVNRLWEQYFATGLVATSEDFGTQGERPSHPELLDYLASELVREHWSLKKLHRLIVTSATYRQSSRVTPELSERDPRNRLLARGPRARVEAEMVRDVALAASGLLSRKIGGPSVFPPQPEGIWTQQYSGEQWTTSSGEDRYRRGLYTFWRRTSPYPTFMSFDAPSREACVVRRSRTNTPLQALATLNDPAFVEAARALAGRMMSEAPTPALAQAQATTGASPEEAASATTAARATYGFRLCVARPPRPAELEQLVALYQQELSYYREHADAATELTLGKPPAENGDKKELPERAAWTVVANVLLNLDSTLTKE
ncbi:MAG TPA: PSD1 and planctomycete cytochrome C domain-containing protein [Pirellulales bacterium]|jgi:hypothetical protein